MPTCICGTRLEGRRRKCDSCKAGPNKTGPGSPPAAAEPKADTTPAGLHARGRALWSTLGVALDSPAGQLALEACRSADRLDELDSVIAGKGVLNLMRFRLSPPWWDDDEQHVSVEVKFQSVLTEARGQQANFAALLAAIDLRTKGAEVPAPTPKATPTSPLDQLAERRKARK